MKKIIATAAAAALALALAGCAAPAASSSSAAPETSSPSASASSSAPATPAISWTTVKTADEAAKGAGIGTFGVMETIEIDKTTYKDPAFSYAEGVASANYETGAIGVIVRKADGKHTAPLTDRDYAEFAETWTKTYEDLDVTLYGPAKGAATVVTWKDGTAEYGVTYQGLGGEEVTMDSDDVEAIVEGIKKANAQEPGKSEPANTESEYISEQAAKDAAVTFMSSGVPIEVTAELVVGGDAPHYLVTANYGGGDIKTVEVDALTGEVWPSTYTGGDDADDNDDDDAVDNDGDDADDDNAGSSYISDDAAEQAAIASEGAGDPIDVDSELAVGGDAPHYVVTINYGGGDIRTVEVDALTGEVWQ